MLKKTTLNHFIIFLLLFTMFFSNNCIEIFAENESVASSNAELSTETTTEAPSDIKNYAENGKTLELNSRAAILIDAKTGTVIYEKNAHEKHYPASITKILTAYIACSEGNFDDTLTVSQSAIDGMGAGGSNIGLVPGEKINFKDGLYGVMLESANEACMAIAEHMSGSKEAFVNKMNEVAQSIGCKESHFANPHGFHDDNHYTTAYDMALIAKKAITNEDFNQIWGTVSHQIPATNLNVTRYLNNKDKMIKPSSEYYYPNLVGGKTGFTDQAGNTLVSYAEKDGAALISVVMKANGYDNTYKDSTALLNYGFSMYNPEQTIFNSKEYSTTAKVIQDYNGKTYTLGTVAISGASDVKMALPKFLDASKITIKPTIEDKLKAPVKLNDIVGKIDIYSGDMLLDTIDAVAITDAPALSDKALAKRALKDNLRKYVMIPLAILIILFILILVVIFVKRIIRAITGNGKRKKKKKRRKKSSSNNKKRPRPNKKSNNKKRQNIQRKVNSNN